MSPSNDPSAAPPDVATLQREIDRLRQELAQQRLHEMRYRELVDLAGDIIYRTDVPGHFTFVNPVAVRMTGYSRDELIGMHYAGLIHPDHRERLRRFYRRQIDERRASTYIEFPIRTRDGRELWLGQNVQLLTEDGHLRGMQAVARDVTERRAMEAALKRSEEYFRGSFDHAAIGMALVDPDGRWRDVNAALCEIVGYDEEELLGMTFQDITHPDDLDADLGFVRQMLAGEIDTYQMEKRYFHRDGHLVWVLLTVSAVSREDGGIAYFISQIQNITRRKQAEKARHESEARIRAVLDATVDAILTLDERGTIESFNTGAERIFGYEAHEVIGHDVTALMPPSTEGSEDFSPWADFDEDGRTAAARAVRGRRKDGSTFPMELSVNTVRLEGRALSTCIIRDVTDRMRLEARLLHTAYHDALTGLPNRKHVTYQLRNEMKRHRDEARAYAVLFLDLDRFKNVNDSLGHRAGDVLLKAVAERLQRCVREDDVVGRFGGDEFVVLLRDIGDAAEAEALAQRILTAFADPLPLEGRPLYASTSIGIALGDGRYRQPEDLLRDADTAMYAAKRAGGMTCRVFDPSMHTQTIRTLDIENNLRKAIDRDELRVYYQPVVNLDTGLLAGFEALVRWMHPERGLVPPNEFVPFAEEIGLIHRIDTWVFETSARQLRTWEERFGRELLLLVNVNCSSRTLLRSDFSPTAERILSNAALGGSTIGLELTERLLIEDEPAVVAMLQRLKQHDVRICVDDFGTGYSALSLLHRLPVDTLKIDRSFVTDVEADAPTRSIVQAITALAHNLGLTVVAEGVETRAQLDVIRAAGGTYAQGYLFAPPVPADEATHMILRRDRPWFTP